MLNAHRRAGIGRGLGCIRRLTPPATRRRYPLTPMMIRGEHSVVACEVGARIRHQGGKTSAQFTHNGRRTGRRGAIGLLRAVRVLGRIEFDQAGAFLKKRGLDRDLFGFLQSICEVASWR